VARQLGGVGRNQVADGLGAIKNAGRRLLCRSLRRHRCGNQRKVETGGVQRGRLHGYPAADCVIQGVLRSRWVHRLGELQINIGERVADPGCLQLRWGDVGGQASRTKIAKVIRVIAAAANNRINFIRRLRSEFNTAATLFWPSRQANAGRTVCGNSVAALSVKHGSAVGDPHCLQQLPRYKLVEPNTVAAAAPGAAIPNWDAAIQEPNHRVDINVAGLTAWNVAVTLR